MRPRHWRLNPSLIKESRHSAAFSFWYTAPMTPKEETVATYNKSARALTEKFNSQPARKQDINLVFSNLKKENPFVIEIGCGNGRDAEEICKHTNKYLGMDISEKLIEIAKERLPDQHFIVEDVETFEFPSNIDAVLAFASLIHVPKETLAIILKRIHTSLNEGGLLFISLKETPFYQEVTKEDDYGTRTYWHYSESDIREIASQFNFESIMHSNIRGQAWMEILLRKSNS
jgi:SAM-dependent methyltransferase